jgi:hypothetical protein
MAFHPVFTFRIEPEVLPSMAHACRVSGARAASDKWTEKQMRIVDALRCHGPMSRQQIAAATGIPINAVCSLVNGLLNDDRIEPTGDVVIVRGVPGRRETRQTQFRVVEKAKVYRENGGESAL